MDVSAPEHTTPVSPLQNKKMFMPPAPPEDEAPRGSMSAARRAWLEVPDQPQKGWIVVDVVQEHPTRPTVDDGAGPVEVDAERLADYDESFEDEDLCEDLSNLASLDAAPLVLGLGRRFRAKTTYTRVGPVLMAVNPNQVLPETEGPHVTDVALAAMKGAVESKKSQAIVISGESGAGKTVSATKIIAFLVERGGAGVATSRQSFDRRELAKDELLARLAASIPALEALGNAGTPLNHNSSRFGKLVKLTYDGEGAARDVVGAHVEEFLLEKARVARRARGAGERNYHFLCQLAARAGQGGRAYAPDDTWDAAVDGENLSATEKSFRDLGVPWEAIRLLSTVGEAVLCLGDGDFEAAAARLAVDPAALAAALRERTVVNTEGAVKVPYEDSEKARVVDALAKALYAALFSRAVADANAAFDEPLKNGRKGQELSETAAFVGILDIYGFEIFARNGLDQLLINFSNEVLQRNFDDCLLAAEAQRYDDDGVPWASLDLARTLKSSAVVDLVTKAPSGLLPLLDEQVKLGNRGSDAAFLTQADKAHRTSDVYSKPRLDRNLFTVGHYAGPVTYDPKGFLLSNSDPLPTDVAAVLRSSDHEKVRALAPVAEERGSRGISLAAAASSSASKLPGLNLAAPRAVRRDSKLPQLRESTSRVFRGQMRSLEATLAACEQPAHYIRCVRPNGTKSPDTFDAALVLRQLKASGIMDLIKIRALGFPERVSAKAFAEEFAAGCSAEEALAFEKALATGPGGAAAVLAARAEERAARAKVDAELADGHGLDGDLTFRRSGKLALPDDQPLCAHAAAALAAARLGAAATDADPDRAWCVGTSTGLVYLKKGTLRDLRRADRARAAQAKKDWEARIDEAKAVAAERQRLADIADAKAAEAAAQAALEAERLDREAAGLAAQAAARHLASIAVSTRLAARRRGAIVRRDVARAALAAALERASRAAPGARAKFQAARDEARAIVGVETKPHATASRLEALASEALAKADAAAAAATPVLADKALDDRAALDAARAMDAAVQAASAAVDAFRGEVYDVLDKSERIATLVGAEHRRRADGRALRACRALTEPHAALVRADELVAFAAPAAVVGAPSLFGAMQTKPGVALVTHKGRVVVAAEDKKTRTLKEVGSLKGPVAVTAVPIGGGCCAASAVARAPAPVEPCHVELKDGSKKPTCFLDEATYGGRAWTALSEALPFGLLTPKAVLALRAGALKR